MENNYGNCNFCNAPKVKNPKTGKIFCSEKCWLKSPQKPPNATTPDFSGVKMHSNKVEPILFLIDEITALRNGIRDLDSFLRDRLK